VACMKVGGDVPPWAKGRIWVPGAPDVDLTSGSCLVIYQSRQVARTVGSFSSFPLVRPYATRKPFNSQSLFLT
jgi:hypothetical protein